MYQISAQKWPAGDSAIEFVANHVLKLMIDLTNIHLGIPNVLVYPKI